MLPLSTHRAETEVQNTASAQDLKSPAATEPSTDRRLYPPVARTTNLYPSLREAESTRSLGPPDGGGGKSSIMSDGAAKGPEPRRSGIHSQKGP